MQQASPSNKYLRYILSIALVTIITTIILIHEILNTNVQEKAFELPNISGHLVLPPLGLTDITLTTHLNTDFSEVQLQGRYHILSYGYLHCPDICPTTLLTIKQVKDKLGAESTDLGVVFYTVDPNRDTPEKLKAYLQYFDPTFIGISKFDSQSENLELALGIKSDIKITEQRVQVSHGIHLFLFNPKAELIAVLVPRPSPDPFLNDVNAFSFEQVYRDISTAIYVDQNRQTLFY